MVSSKKFLSKRIFVYFCFFSIILIGFLIRVWNLNKNPAGFFCDEASIGYNAYSILKTGRDEWGAKFPLFFKAFGEYKNPLDIYFTTLFIAIFGLNEFAVRFTSVFFSLLSLLVLFYIGKEIKDEKFGLWLMFIFSINPWAIHLSRVNLEGLLIFIFFFLIALFFLIKFYKENRQFNLIYFSIFSALTGYSYFPARIFVPLFFITNVIFLLTKKSKSLAKIILAVVIYIIISLPLVFHLTSGLGLNRWRQVSLFTQKNINPAKKFLTSYLLHFSPNFLFLKGDIDMPSQFITRHSIRGIGEFYIWQAPFIIAGIYYLIINRSKFFLPIMLALLVYPIPSSLTGDVSPQATRSIIGIIPFTLLTGFGVNYFFCLIKKIRSSIKLLILACFSIIITFYFIYFVKLLNHYPLYSSDFWGWQYGPNEIINYFLANKKKYDEFYMSGEFNGGGIFLKFYDPENLCQNKCKIGDLLRTPEIYNSKKRQLFSLSPLYLKKLNINDKFKIKKIIYYPNGKVAFYIGEVISN